MEIQPSIVYADDDGNQWVMVEQLDPATVLYRRLPDAEYLEVDAALSDVNVIAVVDVKGGVRKSTAAVHTAHGIYRRTGERVAIGDCDQYHSVADWYGAAQSLNDETGEPFSPWPDEITVISADGDNFHWDLVEGVKRSGARWLVIDTPPNDEAASRRALLGADLMIMPTGPFPMDIRRLLHGMRVAADVVNKRGRSIDARALITGAKMGSKVYDTARKHLISQGIPFFAMPIRDVLAHAYAFGTNLPKLNDYDYLPEDILPMFGIKGEAAIRG